MRTWTYTATLDRSTWPSQSRPWPLVASVNHKESLTEKPLTYVAPSAQIRQRIEAVIKSSEGTKNP